MQSILRKEFEELLPRIARSPADFDQARQFAADVHRVMIVPHITTREMTFDLALQRAYEYVLALETLYTSPDSLDALFTVGRTRRDQALIWLSLLDGSFESMENIGRELGDAIPEWIWEKRCEIARLHNARYRNDALRTKSSARSMAS